MTIKIMFCTCPHVFQDKRYGKRKRVHNSSGQGTTKTMTCTVCAKKKSA